MYNIDIGNDKSTNVVLPDILRKLTSTLQRTDVSFFIYVVAYRPSSYTELTSRQRLMLKKTLMILLKIVLL